MEKETERMMDLLKLILLFFTVIIASMAVGCAVGKLLGQRSNCRIFVYGEITLMASFELVAPWFYLFKRDIRELMAAWALILMVLMLWCVWYGRSRYALVFQNIKQWLGKWDFYKFLALAMTAFQLYLVLFYPIRCDMDDWRFVGDAVDEWTNGTLTGLVKYFPAPLPTLYAVLGRVFSLHPAIVARMLFAALIVVNAYILIWELGKNLFDNYRDACLLVALVGFLRMYSNYGLQNYESLLLYLPWQGKALMTCVIFPAVFLWYSDMVRQKKLNNNMRWNWFFLVVVLLAGTMANSLGAVLCPSLVICCGTALAIYRRKPCVLIKSGLVCIPQMLFCVLELILR